MMQYWWITGDTQYNALITQALLWQVGDGWDYMPSNQSTSEANDDQAFWALAAMSAAEMRFPNPPPTEPQWLALAQAVFNQQARRWDDVCGGGLRWGISSFMTGYTYKNSPTYGALFALGARLGRYTQNGTYTAWSERIFDWMDAVGNSFFPLSACPLWDAAVGDLIWRLMVGLIDPEFRVFDGVRADNCSQIDATEWSYNNGLLLLGSAFLYDLVPPSPKSQSLLLDQRYEMENPRRRLSHRPPTPLVPKRHPLGSRLRTHPRLRPRPTLFQGLPSPIHGPHCASHPLHSANDIPPASVFGIRSREPLHLGPNRPDV